MLGCAIMGQVEAIFSSYFHPAERHKVKTVALHCNQIIPGQKNANNLLFFFFLFLQIMNIFIKFKSGRQFIKLIVFMMTIFCRAHFHTARGRKLFTGATLRRTFLTPQNINASYFQRNYFNIKQSILCMLAREMERITRWT